MAFSLSASALNGEATAATTDFGMMLNDGFLRVYSGTVPANADASLGAAVQAAQCMFAPAAGNVDVSVFTANAIASDTDAAGSAGSLTFFRCYTPGEAVVCQGTVGTIGSGADMEVSSTTVPIHATFAVSSFVYTRPMA